MFWVDHKPLAASQESPAKPQAASEDIPMKPHPPRFLKIANDAKARVRETFRRAQDEARGVFERVRRSFVDFIDRR